MAMCRELLNENDLKIIAQKIAISDGMRNYQFASKPVQKTEHVTCMSGSYNQIYTLTMKYAACQNKKKYVLTKIALNDEKSRKSLPIRAMIENEIYFYSKLYPSLLEFIRETGNRVDRYDLVVDYYLHSLEPEESTKEWLAIRDVIAVDGFHVLSIRRDLTDHIGLIFQCYGYFNAQSYLLKIRNFERFSELVSPMKNIIKMFIESHRFCQNFETVCSAIKKFLKPGKDDTLISYYEEYIEKGKKILVELSAKTGKYDTIIHGNLWSHHLLFKNKENSGKPIDIRFIDWKCAKVGSPVCDLSFCLYSGVPKSTLNNLNNYLKIYYESLICALTEFHCSIDEIFTFNQLLQEWKTYSKFGFLMATQVIFMKCSKVNDEERDFMLKDEEKLFKALSYNEEIFETMIRGLLKHMLETENL